MATENRLAELFGEEVRKVDGVRSVWAHLEMVADAAGDEAKRQQDRRRQALAQLDRLKTGVQAVMEAMPWRKGKPRKIEGQTGVLYLKANGGKQAVEVTDEALVPDECCTVNVTMPADLWRAVREHVFKCQHTGEFDGRFYELLPNRVPSLSAIAEELARDCERCEGNGIVEAWGELDEDAEYRPAENPCKGCDGTGKRGVPGARLAPRGQHVEVR
jgi:hypothetical protein